VTYRAAAPWLAVLVVSVASAGGAQPAPGARAPEIDLPTLAGGRVKLSTLRGQPVVVTFWGTYCPPCRVEFPELVRAQRTYGPAGLYVLGVNGRDQEYSTKDVQRFVDQFAVPFTIALDTRGRSRTAYRIIGLPTTVFVDTAGVVRRIHFGPIDGEALDRGIATILPGR
jgi:peroxiredoxin